ncbi:MAG: chemotaxis response regulator protein-glutamate methylesterase [Lachnospiraceae bacterium]|nr:chemotaxis response regulator protein-glutamate methylesterase [Lachnospiraceae bacterium]
MAKKILVVDDSALVRRVLSDIIDSDKRFQVVDKAVDGVEALELLRKNTYDAVVLDVNMPKMDGIQLLDELRKNKISARVMMASTDTREGAKVTLDALELGALDFIHKPQNVMDCRSDDFKENMLRILTVVADSKPPVFESKDQLLSDRKTVTKVVDIAKKHPLHIAGNTIVAIASSTGGPKALQSVIPKLPAQLNAPVLIVQHMPKAFTASLAERMNAVSEIAVKEAEEGEELRKGQVYIARGGSHMNVKKGPSGKYVIAYSDQPTREGVKPCANYMYESLAECSFDNIVCTVMTGMGADGTEGIRNLKSKKKAYVISQDQESSTVYGMPRSVVNAGLSDQVVPLNQIAQEIILHVGLFGNQ